jgi:hypothetical protein
VDEARASGVSDLMPDEIWADVVARRAAKAA